MQGLVLAADYLDKDQTHKPYTQALSLQQQKLDNSEALLHLKY